MKKIFLLLPVLFLVVILTGCTNNGNLNNSDNISTEQILEVLQVDEDGNTTIDTNVLKGYVEQTMNKELSSNEIEGLLFMLEEEKLARDVYAALYDEWGTPIFNNISQSENTHKNAIKVLVDKYNLDIDFYNDKAGEFNNEILLNLFNDLVSQGSESLSEAYRVGAIVEEIDILDLEKYLDQTDNSDITLTYENLLRGSRNHLRSFTKNITGQGENYEPQILDEASYEIIINGDIERGNENKSSQGNGRNK